MKKFLILAALFFSFAIVAVAYAANGYPWRSHAAPYNYLFENAIDTHQQSQKIGKDQLGGFFYIEFTGNEVDGVPEAVHANCETSADCTVGWKLKGVPVQATLFEQSEPGHPTWCIDPADMPRAPGYTHFHWQGDPEQPGGLSNGVLYDGYLLKLTAQDRFFFKHHGGFLVTPGVDTVTHANVITDCPDPD